MKDTVCIVKDYVRSRRQSVREAFVPLHHPPGHAQVDFGEAVVELRGQAEKIAFFCLILPHSNVWFVKAYPRETTEAFLDGHVSAFAFLGGVPRSILDGAVKSCWPMACLYRSLRFGEEYLPVSALLVDKT